VRLGSILVLKILIPAAFPSILGVEDRPGVRLAHADRGGTDVRGGLGEGGWAGISSRARTSGTSPRCSRLLTIIMIRLLVENVVFRGIELRTARRWGMQT